MTDTILEPSYHANDGASEPLASVHDANDATLETLHCGDAHNPGDARNAGDAALETSQHAAVRRVELLAPAGNMACLHAAVQAGADAVYL
ncbi:MAG: hypothetical protein U0O24_03580, partial [Eggerthellaceae bacterium]